MPTYKDLFHKLRHQLEAIYDTSEAAAISREVLSDITGMSYSQSLLKPDAVLDTSFEARVAAISAALLSGKPLQYTLGYAWFMNRQFMVNEHTLIPRPETEELVQWIIDDYEKTQHPFSILDIGTGSGCIPVSLKLALDKASVSSCDISGGALKVASANALALGATVHLTQLDFLNDEAPLGIYDVIVSNPPYIPAGEKEMLHTNVKDFEPDTALFVPDDDPQLFYRAIALFGKTHLAPHGSIYCELHKDYAEESRDLFAAMGYTANLRKDINGHWRMLKAHFNQ